MSRAPSFELVPIERLKVHEEIQPDHVARLVADLRRDGVVSEPIWVARGSYVVLNGHHRLAALRALGARRVPAWVMEYDSEAIALDRWGPGPALTKREVEERAASGAPFPPKTTKHVVAHSLPTRPTRLTELGVPAAAAQGSPARPSRRSSRVPGGT
ncbi:MAG: ParB N-terminal domain-containing protein [Thermoplasmata archaeon]|nr:ParB N-terminal domain-containing protein [Thermoplasmata archaeon]